MPAFEVIDWDETTHAERKLLHKPVSTLKKRLRLDWTAVFRQAFGPRDNVGTGYEDNLRKGRVAPDKAYKLFLWLFENDPLLASNVEDDILAHRTANFPEQSATWEAMLAKGEFSNVEACKYKDNLGMATFARRQPVSNLKLCLQEEFYFEIVIPFDGLLIAFQGYNGLWYPQAMADGTSALDVSAGKMITPSDEHGQLDPLWEESDTGKHSFLFLLTQDHEIRRTIPPLVPSPHGIPAKVRDDIAKRVFASPDQAWKLFRINLMFK